MSLPHSFLSGKGGGGGIPYDITDYVYIEFSGGVGSNQPTYSEVISRITLGSTPNTPPFMSDTSLLNVVGNYMYWTVPETRMYELIAKGAGGGFNANSNGGQGAAVYKNIQLTEGDKLKIIVGHLGASSSNYTGATGGGGGTFVTLEDNTPLLVAGGAGGTNHSGAGRNAGVTADGASNSPSGSAAIGTCGSPDGSWNGGGGGGFGNCTGASWYHSSTAYFYTSGAGFLAGGLGGDGNTGYAGYGNENGGFGGGGGGCDAGGGGGGYTGGHGGMNGGRVSGGGGSYAIGGWEQAYNYGSKTSTGSLRISPHP
jgi:hypothetical protein